ncbi:MAG: BtpA/SgcQ family protein [Phycisphaerae bacterium]
MKIAPLLEAWAGIRTPVIGMLHLLPLPGSPAFDGELRRVTERLMSDAEALAAGGVHGMMLENFGDAPFFPRRVPAYVTAYITRLACDVKRRFDLPLGVNVLRNDGVAALSAAAAAGADFIRVNVLCGARVTDQGVTVGIAHRLSRVRAHLGATRVRILADINVKHSSALGAPRAIEDEFVETIERGGADAVIVSGSATGKPADLIELREVKRAAGRIPVFIGSGIKPETIRSYLPEADGFIVGTSLKRDAIPDGPVDAERVKTLMRALDGKIE